MFVDAELRSESSSVGARWSQHFTPTELGTCLPIDLQTFRPDGTKYFQLLCKAASIRDSRAPNSRQTMAFFAMKARLRF